MQGKEEEGGVMQGKEEEGGVMQGKEEEGTGGDRVVCLPLPICYPLVNG